MLAVVSPAKKLTTSTRALTATQPVLMDQVERLAQVMRGKSPSDLKALMGISENLSQLNYERYQTFETPFTPENAGHAALVFAGDTYVGLDADSLDDADLTYAQDHLGILSGLYGLLRPLDLMQPYRLEMGTRLKTKWGKNLYEYWGDRITDRINTLTEGHADRTVINLASKEYFSSVNPKKLAGDVITPAFKELRDGKAKMISFMAKKARGSMARYMVQHRVETPEGLMAFDTGGYAFRPDLSNETDWVFLRES